MTTSDHFLVSNSQYFPPSGSVLTLDPKNVEKNGAYLLTGYLPQDFSIRVTRDKGNILIENCGSLPAVWYELDNPYRPTKIDQIILYPGKEITVEDICGHEDRRYLITTALNPNYRCGGKLFPVDVRIRISLSDKNTVHIEYE